MKDFGTKSKLFGIFSDTKVFKKKQSEREREREKLLLKEDNGLRKRLLKMGILISVDEKMPIKNFVNYFLTQLS